MVDLVKLRTLVSEWDCGELYREIDATNAIKVIATDLAAQVLADAERIKEMEATAARWPQTAIDLVRGYREEGVRQRSENSTLRTQLDEMAGALRVSLDAVSRADMFQYPELKTAQYLLDNYDKEKDTCCQS